MLSETILVNNNAKRRDHSNLHAKYMGCVFTLHQKELITCSVLAYRIFINFIQSYFKAFYFFTISYHGEIFAQLFKLLFA